MGKSSNLLGHGFQFASLFGRCLASSAGIRKLEELDRDRREGRERVQSNTCEVEHTLW